MDSSTVISIRKPKPVKPHKVQAPADSLDDLEYNYNTAWVVRECDWFERRLNNEPEEPKEHVYVSKSIPNASRKTTDFIRSKRSLAF